MILILFFFSLKFINIPTFLTSSEEGVDISVIASKGFNFLLLTTVFWVILRSIDFVGYKLKNKALETESKVDDQLIPFAIDLAKVIAIVLGAVMILGDVFEVNITALVTGLRNRWGCICTGLQGKFGEFIRFLYYLSSINPSQLAIQ